MAIITRRRTLYLTILWFLYCLPFLTLILLYILLVNDKLGYVPSFEDLENPKNNLASEVYSEDEVLLGKFYLENRTYVEFESLSQNLVNALLATEDIRFHRHSGVDARGLGRVFVKSILLRQSSSGGGSTITQQLAKNLYPRDTIYYKSRIARTGKLGITKYKEWVTAIKLEKNYTKNEILVMYLNTVPFGSNSYGVKSAARTFFNTTPDSLKIEESALLIGVLKAQSRYNPVRNPERALFRRNIVLSQMLKYGYIEGSEFDSLSILPIELKYKIQGHNEGLATYFRQYLQMTLGANKPERSQYFMYSSFVRDSIEWVTNPLYGWTHKNFKPDGTPYSLFRDGLRVYTTIDSKHQQYAEEAVKQHLKNYLQPTFYTHKEGKPNAPFSEEVTKDQIDRIMQRSMRNTDRYRSLRRSGASEDSIQRAFETPVPMQVFTWDGPRDTVLSPYDSIVHYKYVLRASIMSMDVNTGHVKAYVGGPDFRYFKYDNVKIGKRQVGSTFKPFLYTIAMQEGMTPCDRVLNVSQTFEDHDTTWTPRSPGGRAFIGKRVTLKWGLAHSVNNISAWLIKRFPPQVIVEDIVKKVGIESYIMPVPSIIFGVSDVSLYEMVGAFNTFSNKGVYIQPIFVTRIEDKNGNLLATFQPNQREALSEETAFLMVNLLQGVVDGGTAYRLRTIYQFTAEIGGKTGTTQNQSDGWFMGITPNLTGGVWVGAEDRSVHFDKLALGSGTNMALPIWAIYMKKVYADSTLNIFQEDLFESPPEFNINLDCDVNENLDGFYNYELWEEEFN